MREYADKIDLYVNFLNENLKYTVETGGKPLWFLILKITFDDKNILTLVYSN